MNLQTLFAHAGHVAYADDAASGVTMAAALIMTVLFAAVIYALHSYLLGRVFAKAGVKSWKAWVPVYNNWVLLELGGQQGFWAVLALIPILNIVSFVFVCIAQYNIGLRLGKDGVFVVLAIFLPLVWLIWLAVDGSKWQGDPAQKTTTPAQS